MLENHHSLGLDPRQSKFEGQQMDRRGDLLFMHAMEPEQPPE